MSEPFVHLSSASKSDPGRKRKNNEDNLLALEEYGVYCVADGMGGAEDGEVASQMTISQLTKAFAELSSPEEAASRVARGILVKHALNQTSELIKKGADQKGVSGTGSTAVVLAFDAQHPGRAVILHAGDSRAYRLRAGKLEQLTTDHTLAGAAGLADESQIPPILRGVITRAVGIKERVQLEHTALDVEAKDLYLLCSDGLDKMVPDADIERILNDTAEEALEARANQLVEQANANGGVDNVTVILVDVGELPPISPEAQAEPDDLHELDTSESTAQTTFLEEDSSGPWEEEPTRATPPEMIMARTPPEGLLVPPHAQAATAPTGSSSLPLVQEGLHHFRQVDWKELATFRNGALAGAGLMLLLGALFFGFSRRDTAELRQARSKHQSFMVDARGAISSLDSALELVKGRERAEEQRKQDRHHAGRWTDSIAELDQRIKAVPEGIVQEHDKRLRAGSVEPAEELRREWRALHGNALASLGIDAAERDGVAVRMELSAMRIEIEQLTRARDPLHRAEELATRLELLREEAEDDEREEVRRRRDEISEWVLGVLAGETWSDEALDLFEQNYPTLHTWKPIGDRIGTMRRDQEARSLLDSLNDRRARLASQLDTESDVHAVEALLQQVDGLRGRIGDGLQAEYSGARSAIEEEARRLAGEAIIRWRDAAVEAHHEVIEIPLAEGRVFEAIRGSSNLHRLVASEISSHEEVVQRQGRARVAFENARNELAQLEGRIPGTVDSLATLQTVQRIKDNARRTQAGDHPKSNEVRAAAQRIVNRCVEVAGSFIEQATLEDLESMPQVVPKISERLEQDRQAAIARRKAAQEVSALPADSDTASPEDLLSKVNGWLEIFGNGAGRELGENPDKAIWFLARMSGSTETTNHIHEAQQKVNNLIEWRDKVKGGGPLAHDGTSLGENLHNDAMEGVEALWGEIRKVLEGDEFHGNVERFVQQRPAPVRSDANGPKATIHGCLRKFKNNPIGGTALDWKNEFSSDLERFFTALVELARLDPSAKP